MTTLLAAILCLLLHGHRQHPTENLHLLLIANLAK